MQKNFDASNIENKWQRKWSKEKLYDVKERDEELQKEYILVEWPYPSGNLHIGHWYAFAVPDIYVRYKRMSGIQVLYPMGFDAFGLPAENAAIKHCVDPKKWTEQNVKTMRQQLDSMGASFSWNKTCNSTDTDYYMWTQWMFTKLFDAGLAYKGVSIVNWDPIDNTVIANEQVLPDGTSDRSGAVVEKKEMPQWMLRITNYADRLIDDLDELDWPEHIKESQRQWIGRSFGAEIDFMLSTRDYISCFTTRADTLFGVTYLAISPEHPLIDKIAHYIKNISEVKDYQSKSIQTDEKERLDITREKTGVKLEGVYAFNPATNESIPIYVADYVLMNYGTGSVMGVPAHDKRDYKFATTHNLDIKQVIQADPTKDNTQSDVTDCIIYEGILCNSGDFNGIHSSEAKQMIVSHFKGKAKNIYRLRDWSIGRQRYWGTPIPIVYDPSGNPHPIPLEHLPWKLPEDVDFKPTGQPPLAKSKELLQRTERIFGKGWKPEVETMDTFVDSSWYFLRYTDPSNTEAPFSQTLLQKWMPIDVYFGGPEHTTMHLLYARFWQKALFDIKLTIFNEPFLKRINRGLLLGTDGNKMSKSKGNVIDPDKQVELVGADTVRMYLAFLGPYEGSNYPWDSGGVAGIRRFLERVYGLVDLINEIGNTDVKVIQQLHKTASKIHNDVPQYKFNTAISALMVCVNTMEKAPFTKVELIFFIKLIAPFAPHLAEEMWSELGQRGSVHKTNIPTPDPKQLIEVTSTIGVQINGKTRGSITVEIDANEEAVMQAVRDSSILRSKISNCEIKNVIYKPGKILNIIIDNK